MPLRRKTVTAVVSSRSAMQGKFIANAHLLKNGGPGAGIRLFCFPFAGGGAYVFRPWIRSLRGVAQVCPIQLPGREIRTQEPPARDLMALVADMALEFQDYLDKPFAFFGHSMGALIGFELAQLLRARHGIEPVRFFASGRRPPQLPPREAPLYDLPEDALLAELRRMGGTPEDVLNEPELLRMMLPIVRADFEMVECYRYTHAPPLGCPIAAFGGLADTEITRDDLAGWGVHTTSHFSLHMFPGNHFFLKSSESLLLDQIAAHLGRLASSDAAAAQSSAADPPRRPSRG